MIILGINDGHHASAALMVDGVLVSAAAEERFTRRKGEHGFPRHAIKACLDIAGVDSVDIARVSIATLDLPPIYFMVRRDSDFTVADYWREQNQYWYPVIYEKQKIAYLDIFKDKIDPDNFVYDRSFLRDDHDVEGMRKARSAYASRFLGVSEENINFCDHHACHAYYGLLVSPARNREHLVYTADGWGDGCNGSVWKGSFDNGLTLIKRTANCHIGRMYRYMTLLLGMKPAEHEYKVMGLAPYGNPRYAEAAYQVFSETLQVDGLDFRYNVEPKDNFFHFKKRLEGQRFDSIAAAIQTRTEELVSGWIANGIRRTGICDIIYSGGVAQNIKANKRTSEMAEVNSIFVPPGPHDESLSIGAAYMEHFRLGLPVAKSDPFPNAYLGTSYDDAAISRHLTQYEGNPNFKYRRVTVEDIAGLLASGEVVARFDGRMEFGARALGARSILADPRNTSAVRKINDQVKMRDFWMPFAPSIIEERAADYVINPKNLDNRYMTLAFESTHKARHELPAALHPYDYTLRPNIVRAQDNPGYHALIVAFEKITGVGGLLNTSFNLHGEPVVEKPEDATSTLERSGLRHLAIGSWLLSKSPGKD